MRGRQERQKPREPILPRLRAMDPERHPLFTALEQLRDPKEMSQFVNEYAELLRDETRDPRVSQNALQLACADLNFFAAQYEDDKKAKRVRRWMAVTESGHPIFGTALRPDEGDQKRGKQKNIKI